MEFVFFMVKERVGHTTLCLNFHWIYFLCVLIAFVYLLWDQLYPSPVWILGIELRFYVTLQLHSLPSCCLVPKERISRPSLPETWLQRPVTTRDSLILEQLVINNKSQEKISMIDEGQGVTLGSAVSHEAGLSTVSTDI